MGRYVRAILPLLPKIAKDCSFIAFSAKQFPFGSQYEIPEEFVFQEVDKKKGNTVNSNVDVMWFPWNIPSFPSRSISVLTIHDVIRFRFPKSGFLGAYYTNKEKRSLCNAANYVSHIVADAEFSKQEIVSFLSVPPGKVTVIPLGVNCEFFFPRERVEVEKPLKQLNIHFPYILYVGAVQPSKNVELLLDAYALLVKEKEFSHSLILAGNCQSEGGYRELIGKKIKGKNLNSVYILENMTDDMLPFLYAGADLFVFPSAYEGFGLPPLEAMASGVPVVTSRATSLPEVIGNAGVLVDLDLHTISLDKKACELANACARVLQNETLHKSLVEQGLNRVKQFSWVNTAQQLLYLFHKLSRICS